MCHVPLQCCEHTSGARKDHSLNIYFYLCITASLGKNLEQEITRKCEYNTVN